MMKEITGKLLINLAETMISNANIHPSFEDITPRFELRVNNRLIFIFESYFNCDGGIGVDCLFVLDNSICERLTLGRYDMKNRDIKPYINFYADCQVLKEMNSKFNLWQEVPKPKQESEPESKCICCEVRTYIDALGIVRIAY